MALTAHPLQTPIARTGRWTPSPNPNYAAISTGLKSNTQRSYPLPRRAGPGGRRSEAGREAQSPNKYWAAGGAPCVTNE